MPDISKKKLETKKVLYFYIFLFTYAVLQWQEQYHLG